MGKISIYSQLIRETWYIGVLWELFSNTLIHVAKAKTFQSWDNLYMDRCDKTDTIYWRCPYHWQEFTTQAPQKFQDFASWKKCFTWMWPEFISAHGSQNHVYLTNSAPFDTRSADIYQTHMFTHLCIWWVAPEFKSIMMPYYIPIYYVYVQIVIDFSIYASSSW